MSETRSRSIYVLNLIISTQIIINLKTSRNGKLSDNCNADTFNIQYGTEKINSYEKFKGALLIYLRNKVPFFQTYKFFLIIIIDFDHLEAQKYSIQQ